MPNVYTWRGQQVSKEVFEYMDEQCLKIHKLKELVKLQEEYINMCIDELDEVCLIASVHGWKSSRWDLGVEMRNRLERANKELGR